MRKMYAKLLSLVALAAMLIALAACGQPNVAPLTATPANHATITVPSKTSATATSVVRQLAVGLSPEWCRGGWHPPIGIKSN